MKGFNDYESAMLKVGSILEPYDAERAFICYGFGAYLPSTKRISNCFSINGNEKDPMIFGSILQVTKEYKEMLSRVALAGPTYFNPVLQRFMKNVKKLRNYKMYHVLLILTDGIIHDMEDAKRTIVDLSCYPCSIIIVGLGTENFKQMEELDSDLRMLQDREGRRAERDIV